MLNVIKQNTPTCGMFFSNKTRLLTLILSSIVLLYFIFAPAINGSYYAGDDSRYAFGGYTQPCKLDDGFEFMLTLGRPIQAYLDCINYKTAYTLERMSFLRFSAVAFMGCAMGLLAEYLITLGLSFWVAFFAAGSIFLIPRLYGDTVITAATSLPLSLIFVLLGYQSINKSHQYAYNRDPQSKKHKLYWFALAGFLTFCSLLTYPALTFFFVSLIMLKVIFSPADKWPTIRKEAIQETALFLSMCVIYFICANYNMRYHALAPVPDQYRVDHPNLNIIEIIKRLAEIGNVFSSIWEILPGGNLIKQGWLMIGALIVGASGAAYSFFIGFSAKKDKTHALNSLMQRTLFAVALFILSSAFILIIPSNVDVGGSRLLFGVTASGIALITWCLCYATVLVPAKYRHGTFISLMAALFLTEAVIANPYVQATSLVYQKKTDFIRTSVADYLKANPSLRRIHFVLVRPDYPYNRFFLANSGLMQTLGRGNYDIKWCSLPRGVAEDEPHHQREMQACINKLPKNSIGVTYSYEGEPFLKTKNMLVITNKNNII